MRVKHNTARDETEVKKSKYFGETIEVKDTPRRKKKSAGERLTYRVDQKNEIQDNLLKKLQLKKVQMVLSQEQFEHISAMKNEIGLATNKAFFDLAISLLYWVLTEKKNGRIIASIDKEEQKIRELVLPGVF